jgi:ATP/maltotriose-dependent transcriptional regulator MalT
VLFISSVYRLGTGSFDRVERDLGRAVDLCLRIADPRFHGESLTVLGLAALYRNDLDRADELFRSVGDAGRRFDNQQHRVWARVGRAVVHYRRGDLASATTLLEETETILSVGGSPLEWLRLHGLRASIQLEAGDVPGAERSALRAEAFMADMSVPTSHYLLEGFAGVANVRLALFDPRMRLSTARAKRAVAALARYAALFQIGRPRAIASRAALDVLEGRTRRGRRGFLRAEAEARRLGMLHEVEHCRALAARLVAGVSSAS